MRPGFNSWNAIQSFCGSDLFISFSQWQGWDGIWETTRSPAYECNRCIEQTMYECPNKQQRASLLTLSTDLVTDRVWSNSGLQAPSRLVLLPTSSPIVIRPGGDVVSVSLCKYWSWHTTMQHARIHQDTSEGCTKHHEPSWTATNPWKVFGGISAQAKPLDLQLLQLGPLHFFPNFGILTQLKLKLRNVPTLSIQV